MAFGKSWMIKWNSNSNRQRGSRDFKSILSRNRSFLAEGFDTPLATLRLKAVQENDLVFCYQSNRRDILGVAQVTAKRSRKDGSTYLNLKPLRYFKRPIDIQQRRREIPELHRLVCLKRSGNQILQRVSANETRLLARVCRILSLIRLPQKKLARSLKATLPAVEEASPLDHTAMPRAEPRGLGSHVDTGVIGEWTKCPVCGCDVKTINLAKHRRHVHEGVAKCSPENGATPTRPKSQRKIQRRRTGSRSLDLNLFPQCRTRSWGSGQTRKFGSRRYNRGHR